MVQKIVTSTGIAFSTRKPTLYGKLRRVILYYVFRVKLSLRIK